MPVEPPLDDCLKAKATELGKTLTALLDPYLMALFHAEPVSARLCHYTDFAGFKGILETGRLWATYARTLNDSSELKYGHSVVSRYMQSIGRSELGDLMEHAAINDSRDFVTCFCESSDVLSMWRSYAGHGGGFCIEFDGPALFGCSWPPHKSRMPFTMTYGMHVSQQVKELLDVLWTFSQRGTIEAVMSGGWLSVLALKFKHPAFQEEREQRLVIRNPSISEMKFRSGLSDIKPYIELCPQRADDSVLLPIVKVVFGPTLRDDDALIEVINLMLERNGYVGVEVASSGIPYRL